MQPSKKRSLYMSTLIKEGLESRIKAFSALHNYQYLPPIGLGFMGS